MTHLLMLTSSEKVIYKSQYEFATGTLGLPDLGLYRSSHLALGGFGRGAIRLETGNQGVCGRRHAGS